MASVLEELEGLFPAAASETVYDIRLDLISPDPDQPRKDFDSAELDDLALSIESSGVLSPVLLRPDPEQPGRYLLVTGERRYRASERARRTSIPALIRDVEPGLLLVLQLVENVQRSELRPLETAQALAALLGSTPGLTKARAAALLGKSQSWVSQHLALLGYVGATRTALDEDLLQSPETARLFEKLPEQDQTELLEQARTAGSPISRNAVAAVQPVVSPSPEVSSAKRIGRPARERTISLPPVTAAQLTVLFTALGLGTVPSNRDDLWAALLSRLTT